MERLGWRRGERKGEERGMSGECFMKDGPTISPKHPLHQTRIQTHTHTRIQTHTPTRIQTYTHTNIHTYTHTHIHTPAHHLDGVCDEWLHVRFETGQV